MRRLIITAGLALATPAPGAAHTPEQAPAAEQSPAAIAATLAKPPADAELFTTMTGGAERGRVFAWRTPDGARWTRDSFTRAGFFTEIDQRILTDARGLPVVVETRGATTQGPAAETYAAKTGYQSPADRGPPAPAGSFYLPYEAGPGAYAALLEALLKAPGNSLRVHPGGTARLSELARATVSSGGQRKSLVAYAVDGLGFAPIVLWTDKGRYFGTVGRLSTLPAGWHAATPDLLAAQTAALAARAEALVGRIAPALARPLVFRGVRLFDSEAGAFRENMTVVVIGDRIRSVTRGGAIPRGADVIDGAGRTLLPALWDSHLHFGGDETGVRLLSQGIAHVRDPGNDIATSVPRRKRIDAGTLLGPRIVASLMIDGPGPLATPGLLVANEAEALAAVRAAKANGFSGVKLYGSLDPALVKPIATEAHRLGLRVHGHIQRGFRPADAVAAGYDEITHINWVMMQGMPQSVIDRSNGLERFYGPYRYGPALDFKAEPMNGFLADLARRRIAVDPTLTVFEGDFIARDEMPKSLLPFAGQLPPLVARYALGPDIAPTADVPVEQIERGFRKWRSLVKELTDRGVPIVAGTDGNGLGLVRELELYAEAGLTPAQALRTATIVPATLFGLGARTGSVRPGKDADLLLVAGDPSRSLGDLRRVELVVTRGRLMRGADLRRAASLGRPEDTTPMRR